MVIEWMDILIYMTGAPLDMCKALLVTMFDVLAKLSMVTMIVGKVEVFIWQKYRAECSKNKLWLLSSVLVLSLADFIMSSD